jgi:XTP/dITP diphosphohydrolase
MNRVVLATHNSGKLREFGNLLAPLGIDLVPLSNFASTSPEETGWTFVENALLKARNACVVSGLPAIADDSGLEVDALRGEPGIFSARYAGVTADDEANLAKLLDAMVHVEDAERTARYRCVLAFMRWEREPAPVICEATWEGRIGRERRGTGGFGYDPVFVIDDGRTVAQLEPKEKNELSHRGRAMQKLFTRLSAGDYFRPPQ